MEKRGYQRTGTFTSPDERKLYGTLRNHRFAGAYVPHEDRQRTIIIWKHVWRMRAD